MDDKCLVCLKAGGNLNIFTTYNICGEREELYVEVIRNCFSIQIPPDAGLVLMCNECSLKLRKAYKFKNSIDRAVSKLLAAQVTVESTEDEQYSQVDYLEDVSFDNSYDLDTVLNPETGQISYTLHKINDNQETIQDDQKYLIDLDNHVIVDKQVENNVINCKEDERRNDKHIILNTEAQLYKLHTINEVINVNQDTNLLHDGVIVKVGNEIINESNNSIKTYAKNRYEATILHPETGQLSYILGKANEEEKNPSQNKLTVLDNRVLEKNELSKSDTGKKFMKKIKIIKKGVKNGSVDLVKGNLPENIKSINIVSNDLTKDVNAEIVKENLPENFEKINVVKRSENVEQVYCVSRWDTISKTKIVPEMLPGNEEMKDLEQIVSKDVKGGMSKEFVPGTDKEIKVNKAVITHLKDEVVKENVLGKAENIHIVKNGVTEGVKCEMVTENVVKMKKGVTMDVGDETVTENVAKKGKKAKKRKQMLSCKQCNAEFATKRKLSAHAHTHATHECGACGLVLATRDKLRAHRRTHDQGPFTCRYCNQEFNNFNTRNAHVWRVHSKPEPFKCSQCDQRFKTFLKRLRHMQTAHGVKEQYPCHYCKRTFAYAAYRTRHVRIMHHNERPHQCPQCPLAFAKRGILDCHLASKHGVGEMKHQCSVCFKRFPVKSVLMTHLKTHMERFSCIQCEQKFKKSTDLDAHLKTHDCGDAISMSLDFVASLHLDELPEDYAFLDPSYLDLNEL